MKARGTGPMRSTPRSPARQRRNGILLWIPCVRNQTFLREQIAYQRRKMDQQAPHFCTMRVQSDSFSFSLHGTVVLVGAVLVLCGCQAPDPYAPFNRAPIDMETSPSTSWEGVRDHTTLPTAGSTEKWPGPLVRDILQLGPWPPASTSTAGRTRFGLATIHRLRRHPHSGQWNRQCPATRGRHHSRSARHHRCSEPIPPTFSGGPYSPCRHGIHGIQLQCLPHR